MLIAGVLALTAYSWYTNAAMDNALGLKGKSKNKNKKNKNNNRNGGISQWDLGWAMWMGFISSCVLILGSIHAIVVAFKMKDEPKDEYRYHQGETRFR